MIHSTKRFLRREQMKMQLVSTGQAVKEKDFFCKSEFDTFEATVRQNFDPRSEANPEVWDCPFNIFCFEFCFKTYVQYSILTFFCWGRSDLLHRPTGRRRLQTGLWQYQDYDHDKGDCGPMRLIYFIYNTGDNCFKWGTSLKWDQTKQKQTWMVMSKSDIQLLL